MKNLIKKKFFLISNFILISFIGYNQFGDLNIKQRFDNVYTQLYGPIYNITSSTNNINDQGQIIWIKSKLYEQSNGSYTQASVDSQNAIGSSRSGSLEALLRMYEATCDMKYIWEFMEQATHIINMRADKVSPQQSVNPYLFVRQVPWHGRILMPLAHFVYIVNSRNLTNISIPTSHRPNFNNYSTIGGFSNFVNTQNIQMMNYLLGKFWRGSDECLCRPTGILDVCNNGSMDSNTSKSISELNYQGPYGCALIYMYLANPSINTYGVFAVEMARAYLVTRNGILTYNAAYNNYGWFHDGWQQERSNTNSPWTRSMDYTEDIGHGIWDIYFPILYNKFYSNLTGPITTGQYFENYQMVRFRNTFTKVIYNQFIPLNCLSTNQNTFDCNVFGSCNGHYGSTSYSSYQMDAKSWTDLYLYDNVSGAQSGDGVYTIMMNYYQHIESCLPITRSNYEGTGILGLACMCSANYDRENLYPCGINQVQLKPSTNSISYNSIDKVITINSEKTTKTIFVYSITGEKVLFVENENEIILDKLLKGIYIVVSEFNDNSIETEKIVIE